MIFKHYSKMILVAVAAASLVFAGCGGKKDDVAMGDHAGSTMASDANATTMAVDSDTLSVVAKPSSNAVYFDFDSAEINDAGHVVLNEYAAWLNANADVNVTIEGNCDERGSREYNLALGDRRANSLRSALATNGVDVKRMDTVSFGEERPVCTQSGAACWAQNRHGDIVNR